MILEDRQEPRQNNHDLFADRAVSMYHRAWRRRPATNAVDPERSELLLFCLLPQLAIATVDALDYIIQMTAFDARRGRGGIVDGI
jgi:hypothetical protein